jgi:hypothetical protein
MLAQQQHQHHHHQQEELEEEEQANFLGFCSFCVVRYFIKFSIKIFNKQINLSINFIF